MPYCKSHHDARVRLLERMSKEEREIEKEKQRIRGKNNYQKNREKILVRNRMIYKLAKEYRDNVSKGINYE